MFLNWWPGPIETYFLYSGIKALLACVFSCGDDLSYICATVLFNVFYARFELLCQHSKPYPCWSHLGSCIASILHDSLCRPKEISIELNRGESKPLKTYLFSPSQMTFPSAHIIRYHYCLTRLQNLFASPTTSLGLKRYDKPNAQMDATKQRGRALLKRNDCWQQPDSGGASTNWALSGNRYVTAPVENWKTRPVLVCSYAGHSGTWFASGWNCLVLQQAYTYSIVPGWPSASRVRMPNMDMRVARAQFQWWSCHLCS